MYPYVPFRKPFVKWVVTLILCCGLSGCGGGNGSTSPPPGMTVHLSPNGPSAERTLVSIGARASGTPNAAGELTLRPPDDATSTTFVTEVGTGTPLLLAVVPKGTSAQTSAIEISPRSTIAGMMFLEAGAWLLPQDKQQQFFALIRDNSKVAAAVAAFEAAYQADGHAFSRLGTDRTLTEPVQAALDSVVTSLTNSSLMPDLQAALGIVPQSKNVSATRAWKVVGPSTVSMTVDGNKMLLASNGSNIFRYVEVARQDGSVLNDVMLPETTEAPVPLLPQPLSESPLYAMVTGGLNGYNASTDANAQHIYPVAASAIIRIVFPFVSCLTGVNATLHADKVLAKGFPTTDPLFNELFKILVFNKESSIDAVNMPAGKLVTQLAGIFATHQRLTVSEYFSIFKGWILDEVGKAILADLPDLTKAVVAEAETVGEKVTAEGAQKGLAIVGGPYVKAALILYKVLTTAIDIGLESFRLATTPATDRLIITGTGDVPVTIRSAWPPGDVRALPVKPVGSGGGKQ